MFIPPKILSLAHLEQKQTRTKVVQTKVLKWTETNPLSQSSDIDKNHNFWKTAEKNEIHINEPPTIPDDIISELFTFLPANRHFVSFLHISEKWKFKYICRDISWYCQSPKNKMGIKFSITFKREGDSVSKDPTGKRFFSASWMFMSMCQNKIFGGILLW